MLKKMSVLIIVGFVAGCSDSGSGGGFEDIQGGLTNYSAACSKHGGLDRISDKGKTLYLYCKNGKKLTYKKR